MHRPGVAASEEELRAHLAAIVDSSDDAILSKNLDGIITSWNAGARRIYGYDAEEVIGRPVSMLVPEDRADEIPKIMERLRRGERVDHFETVRRAKDGRRLDISLTVSPIRNAQGEITGASAVARDITRRTRAEKALRESERRQRLRGEQFETLLNQAPLGVYFVDADFRLQQVNPVAEPVFEVASENLIGGDFEEVLRSMWNPERAEQIVGIFRHTLETGEPFRVPEFAEVRADRGVTEYYDWRTERIVLPDGRYGVVCYFRDISEQVNARMEIARSEERYRTLFTSIDEGFCVIEVLFDEAERAVDYRFIEVNPAFERHNGLPDAQGKRVRELVPDLEERWFEIYGRVALTGEPARFMDHSQAMDGRWFDLYAFRLGGPDSRRVAVLFSDVSERKRAEEALRESEERLRLAKAAGALGIHDFNVAAGTIEWDDRTREIWGVGEDEAVTYEAWRDGLHPEDRDSAEAALQRALDPEDDADYFVECRVINRKDGVTRWIQVTGQPAFSDGQPVRLVGTVQDVTERKLAEETLREADRRKDEFIATLAHELRNPLAAIRTASTLLSSASADPARVGQVTPIIERQSSLLVRLIDDLLDVTRISRGKLKLERKRIDLNGVIRQVVSDSVAMFANNGLSSEAAVPEEPMMVVADPVRIAQVVNNLLHNACKFTPGGGKVQVSVERERDEAVIRVRDTGRGMSGEELSRIFDMFEQVDASLVRTEGGLGIGLSLARSVVELHGGRIEARSDGPGKGSQFTVRLVASDGASDDAAAGVGAGGARDGSVRPAGRKTPQRAPEAPPQAEGRRIVAAEDNFDVLYAVSLMLRLKGHTVETAADGLEALEKVREHRPDVALLDIGMPGMDGYEVARNIRREPWGREMLLIAMTGWGQEKDRRLASEAGFDKHLTKPVDMDALHDILQSGRE